MKELVIIEGQRRDVYLQNCSIIFLPENIIHETRRRQNQRAEIKHSRVIKHHIEGDKGNPSKTESIQIFCVKTNILFQENSSI